MIDSSRNISKQIENMKDSRLHTALWAELVTATMAPWTDPTM